MVRGVVGGWIVVGGAGGGGGHEGVEVDELGGLRS